MTQSCVTAPNRSYHSTGETERGSVSAGDTALGRGDCRYTAMHRAHGAGHPHGDTLPGHPADTHGGGVYG